jgi:hypothetical protein
MKHLKLLLFFICLYPAAIFGQVDSSSNQTDSLRKDTLRPKPRPKKITDSTRVTTRAIFNADSLHIKDSLRLTDSLRSVQQASDSLKRTEQQIPAQILKEGDKIFLSTKGRKYWRLQNMLNCEGNRVTDYIDIYFKKI